MSTKTVTIRQSCVAPSLVHASCWQAQVGHPETTGHRPSHAGWGPVGVECHLGFCQILAGRFPCNGYEHIQIYTTATKNGVVFLYDVQPDCFFNSEKQPWIFPHTWNRNLDCHTVIWGCGGWPFQNTCGKHHDGGLEPTMENTSKSTFIGSGYQAVMSRLLKATGSK